jgi:hypothetical protein
MASMTAGIWFKLDKLPVQGKYFVPLSKEQDPSYWFVIAGDHIQFAVRTENNEWYSPGTVAISFVSLNTSVWYHMMGTYDGSKVRLYLDGNLMAEGSQTISGKIFNGALPLSFGKGGYSTIDYFAGAIDEAEIWNRPLSQSEITNEYKRLASSYVLAPAPAASDYMVGAFYMPAWRMGTHSGWTKIAPFPDRTPLLGYFDEGSPEVADWEIKWALENGISFFVYDWFRCPDYMACKAGPITDQSVFVGHALNDGLLKSRYLSQFKFAVMYTTNYPWVRGTYSLDDLENNLMPYLVNKYFKNPSYLKIGNKPVLFIYTWQDLKQELGGTDENLMLGLQKMRQASVNAGFSGLMILAQDMWQNQGPDISRLGFDY